MHPLLTRAASGLPDAVMAAWFLSLWIAPMRLGSHGVRNGMLVMLVEFVLIHASAMIGAVVFASGVSRRKRLLALAGFAAFYLLFVAAFAASFEAWWPFLAFGWLLLGKLAVVLDPKQPGAERLQRLGSMWALSIAAYVVGVFVTVMLPLPRLGITPGVVAQLGLPGGGLWVDKPHTVIAFGTMYFAVLAWAKWRDVRLPGAMPAAAAARAQRPG